MRGLSHDENLKFKKENVIETSSNDCIVALWCREVDDSTHMEKKLTPILMGSEGILGSINVSNVQQKKKLNLRTFGSTSTARFHRYLNLTVRPWKSFLKSETLLDGEMRAVRGAVKSEWRA